MQIINKLRPLLLALAAALPALAQADIQYAITRLVLPGDGGSPTSINNSGVVAGGYYSYADMGTRAFLWSSGNFTLLPATGVQGEYFTEINQHGAAAMVRGELDVSRGHAYRYQDGELTRLGSLKPYATTRALGLNNNGAIVGDSGLEADTWSTDAARHATHYKDGILTDLGTLGGRNSVAESVNDAGVIVGKSQTAGGGSEHAFIYVNGQMTDLGTLGGGYSAAYGINNVGQIVGSSVNANGQQNAFFYHNGAMTDLGWLGSNSYARAVNEHGQAVVGQSGGGGWLYSGGAMHNLSTLIDPASGLTIQDVTDINDLGQIVGSACNSFGECSGVLLTPVPEPETYGMMLAGLGVLGYAARRRKPKGRAL
ncbi:hypothetical protein ASD15_10740 [Massilia sp. Root351]|jgi:probable HAF family extracellular repeat protein|uniref:FxDxF family PEP-CTERM protein n=1 Tax=Massilia sp. Root351 TaxID=1736522 RepID=UPI0007110108|nr:FxDxF family PEP-CTERM protein [Massilia sp. Root351]KQV82487.1 hypothetical protein ASD15_10740 [Massilia sp. Root351]